MGLFFPSSNKASTNKASTSGTGTSNFSGRGMISPREAREQIRRDFHDELGRDKGEAAFSALSGHFDNDGAFRSKGVSGREITEMLKLLKGNHQDNLHEGDIKHIEGILNKHFND